MEISQLQDLARVSQAQYLKELSSVQRTFAEEATLRQRLSQIDEQMAQEQQNAGSIQHMRKVGADMAWYNWAGQMRANLNVQLAHVLARKAYLMGNVRHAFGKKMVSEKILDDEVAKQKATRNKLSLDSVLALHCLRDHD